MAEDSSKNRLEEALDLFEQIVNSHYFKDIDVMLFLNKDGCPALTRMPLLTARPVRRKDQGGGSGHL
eukprot:2089673-Prymnesium_polylepis.1